MIKTDYVSLLYGLSPTKIAYLEATLPDVIKAQVAKVRQTSDKLLYLGIQFKQAEPTYQAKVAELQRGMAEGIEITLTREEPAPQEESQGEETPNALA